MKVVVRGMTIDGWRVQEEEWTVGCRTVVEGYLTIPGRYVSRVTVHERMEPGKVIHSLFFLYKPYLRKS
jgi:hypothetical protein